MSLVEVKSFWSSFLFFLFLITFPHLSEAGWEDLKLQGGQIYAIAIDPSNPSKMFAGTYYGGGLFVTTDSGDNWLEVLMGAEDTALEGQATFRNTAVWAVEIAPSNSNVVWVAHNHWVAKSVDGGNTWTHIPNRVMQGGEFRICRSLVIDPTNPDIVYVGTGGPGTTSNNGAVYKTKDGGISWSKMGANDDNEFPSTVVEVAINPQNSNTLWALDYQSYEGHLYHSIDAGQSWELDYTIPVSIGYSGLIVKPDEPNVIFLATYSGIMRFEYPQNEEGAIHWDAPLTITTPADWYSGQNIHALAFDPNNPDILYAAGRESKLGRSTDGGITFPSEWYETDHRFIDLAVHPVDSNIIYGGELTLGFFRGAWSNGEYTWDGLNNGINAIQVNDITADPNNSGHLLAATMAGVFEKQGDVPWAATEPLIYNQAYAVAFDPSDPTGATFYAGIEGYLQKTTDHGVTWSSSNRLPSSDRVSDIFIDPNIPATIYATSQLYDGSPGAVYKSTDSGVTLTEITPGGASFNFSTVVVNPEDSTNVFAGGGNYHGARVPGALYESNDAGESWTPVLEDVIVNALAIDPADSNIVYAGCGYSGGTEVPLYKSTDGGTTWQQSYEGMPGRPTRYGVWGSGPDDVYVLRHTGSMPKGGDDDSYISHYGSSGWSSLRVYESTPLHTLWGKNASDIFAAGKSGVMLHYNGTAWSPVVTGSNEDLLGVWGDSDSPTEAIAVGRNGIILRCNSTNCSPMNSTTARDIQAVWGASDGSLYFAVGSFGTILTSSGANWSQVYSPSTVQLEDVWGVSATGVFAVGEATEIGTERYYTILRYNGSQWSRMTKTPKVPMGHTGTLRAVWGVSVNDVWAVGDDGIILHYTGSVWDVVASATTARLHDIWGSSADNIYTVGLFGTLLQYNGTQWSSTALSDIMPSWNGVTDIAFSPEGKLYASTSRQGIYASANQAESWINLSAPPYSTNTVTTGSIIVGNQAGAYSLEGEGILYGQVKDSLRSISLSGSTVKTDYGKSTRTSSSGGWQMHHPGGYFDITASKPGYTSARRENIPVLDATFTSVNFSLDQSLSAPVVGNIPNQTISAGGTFKVINLGDYVVDGDHTDIEINWRASGQSLLTVNIVDRVAMVSQPPGWNSAETITFTATDPGGLSSSNSVTFMVDSDFDGIPDDIDTNSGTVDSDADGMPDNWELRYNLDPAMHDAFEDADGDGFTNLQEFRGGSDPRDAESIPSLMVPTSIVPGIYILLEG